jgi:hypothetical protein
MMCPANSFFMVYLTTLCASQDTSRWMVGRLFNGGIVSILNEAAKVKSRCFFNVWFQGLRKTTEPSVWITDILAKIRIEHLLNTSLERYDYTHLLVPPHVL